MVAWITNEDVANYGSDLTDFAQRAALHAVAPTLQQIEQQNAELRERLRIEARRNLDQAVERALPDYRERDKDPEWRQWLRGREALSGQIRQHLLNAAIERGDVRAIVAFFNGFQKENRADSTQASSAAYGRTRSARAPSEKPVYSRAQVAELYAQHRRGAYVGREAEWQRQDSDIIAAGREGRIRNPVDLFGK